MDKSAVSDASNVSVKPVHLESELKQSFLDYAMSVIVSRALPDIRDGLKPVHRRILYTMHQLGFVHTKPYHKSVRVVGEVLGKYHPHGDQAVYQTMVGMAQDFAKRYPILDGQGNWGSVDGDEAAAMRYTEVRMQKIAQEILSDLDKETVRFVPNFDESTVEPVVLPSRIPQLLVNGSAGIAVGMATSIPPHNLGEIVDACIALLQNPALSEQELFAIVPAPDFPTGGIICGRQGIIKAYTTGHGNVIIRGVVDIEENKKGTALIVKEIPYQVNKAELAINIAKLVKDKVVEGISNIRDESSKKGMRLVIELRRGETPAIVLNQLYKHTSLQTSMSILMLGLLDNQPVILPLKELLRQFLIHREEVVYRRTQFDLNKAQAREHILLGFTIALNNIDDIIVLIKKSSDAASATEQLIKKFSLSDEQCKAILDMRLQRLTGLEQEKIHQERGERKELIKHLQRVLGDQKVLHEEILSELKEVKEQYADKRRTLVAAAVDSITEVDLIPDEDVIITLTKKGGYIKRVPLTTYGIQHRGGKGKMGVATSEDADDMVQDAFVTRNHDQLLFFTNLGRVYGMPVYEVPEASRTAKGRAVINLLPLTQGEYVVKLLSTKEMENKFIIMLTKKGTIKRTQADAFDNIRSTGIRAALLNENDELVFCDLSSGNDEVIIATAHGQGIHFKETEVRSMGRHAAGVVGIRLRDGDVVVGMEVVADQEREILFATQNGYGKKVAVKDFRVSHRGGVGVRTIPTDGRNGLVVGLVGVGPESHVLLIDSWGKIIRLSSSEIRTLGRQARGVRLIRLEKEQRLVSIVAFDEQVDEGGQEPAQ